MSCKKISIDMYGVIFDNDSYWKDIASNTLNREIKKTNNKYLFNERYGLSDKESELVWKNFDWERVPLYEDSIESLMELKELNFKIYLTSIINRAKIGKVISSIGYHKLPIDDILISNSTVSKINKTKDLEVDVVIDDLPRSVMLASIKDIETVYFLDRHYSDQGKIKSCDNIFTVKTLSQAVTGITLMYDGI